MSDDSEEAKGERRVESQYVRMLSGDGGNDGGYLREGNGCAV